MCFDSQKHLKLIPTAQVRSQCTSDHHCLSAHNHVALSVLLMCTLYTSSIQRKVYDTSLGNLPRTPLAALSSVPPCPILRSLLFLFLRFGFLAPASNVCPHARTQTHIRLSSLLNITKSSAEMLSYYLWVGLLSACLVHLQMSDLVFYILQINHLKTEGLEKCSAALRWWSKVLLPLWLSVRAAFMNRALGNDI